MRKIEYVILLTLIVFIAYLPSLFGRFVWDDEDFVYANQYVQNFQIDKFFIDHAIAGRGKSSNYYRPIQMTTYSILYKIAGPNPTAYHVFSLLAHISATIALFYLFEKISQSGWRAFLITLLFATHPVQTETVSYISGVSDSLFVLFGALSLLLYFSENKKKYYISIFLYLCTLLSKETGIIFLGLLSVTHVLFFKKRAWTFILPYIILTILYLVFHFSFINTLNMKEVWGESVYATSVFVRIFTFIHNQFLYYSLVIFPKELFMERDYTITIMETLVSWKSVAVILFNGGIIGLLYGQRKSKNFTLLLFCFLGYYISFIPYTGLVLINGIFYEHFLYLPLIFFFGFFCFFIPEQHRKSLQIFVAIIVILYMLRSYARQHEWIEPLRFYAQTLEHAPQSIRIRNGLAMAYSDNGEFERAITEYKNAIKQDPQVPNLYHNLALVYLQNRDFKTAEKYFLQAVRVDANFHYSYISLIQLYKNTEQTQKIAQWERRFNDHFKVP